MPAPSQASINRRIAGLDPLPDPERSKQGKKAAAKRYGKASKRVGVKFPAKGKTKRETSRNAENFLVLSLDSQRVRRAQATAIAINAAPEIVAQMVKVATGKRAEVGGIMMVPGFKEQIAAARLVLEVAQVTGAEAEKTDRKADAPLNEVEVSDLRALLGAIEHMKAQQPVTVEGDSARVSTDWRQSSGNPLVADAEIVAESTGCQSSSPDSASDALFGADRDPGRAAVDDSARDGPLDDAADER